jgi:saccharopine dehydrogenase-like NADP-dependent oxidoreductase
MRILITGGGGAMGAYACQVLAADPAVDQVIVADIDEARALEVAEKSGSKATAVRLDLADADALRAALEGVDIVLSTAGPFYVHGRRVLEAAIDAGIDYLDICDDWEPTLEMLELDERAREAGTTAVIGMGASPGISNLLAVLAMNECDQVDRVFTAWRAGAGVPRPTEEVPEPKATAAIIHWVHNVSDPIKIWRGGALIDAWALEEIPITYPGRGSGSVWVCGHPEPLTIPRARPEVQESLNVMTSRQGMMDALIRISDRVKSGEFDVPTASNKLLLEPNMFGRAAGAAPIFPDLFALVEGVKDGQPIRAAARPLSMPDKDMGEMTGIPLAVATLMMVRGEVERPGVHGPEIVAAERFFEDLAGFAADAPAEGPYVEVLTEPIRAQEAASA